MTRGKQRQVLFQSKHNSELSIQFHSNCLIHALNKVIHVRSGQTTHVDSSRRQHVDVFLLHHELGLLG